MWHAYPDGSDYGQKIDKLGPFMKKLMIGTCRNERCLFNDNPPMDRSSRPPPGSLRVGELTRHSPSILVTNVRLEQPPDEPIHQFYLPKHQKEVVWDYKGELNAETNSLERLLYQNPTPAPDDEYEPEIINLDPKEPEEEDVTLNFEIIEPTEPTTAEPIEIDATYGQLQRVYDKRHEDIPEPPQFVFCPDVSIITSVGRSNNFQ